jgi:hypothetical protein
MIHNFLLVFSNRIYARLVHTINGPYDFNFSKFGNKENLTTIFLESEIPNYLKKSNLRFKIDKYKRNFNKYSFEEGINQYSKYSQTEDSILNTSSKYFSSEGK